MIAFVTLYRLWEVGVLYTGGGITARGAVGGRPPPTAAITNERRASAHVCQGAVRRAHTGGTAASGAAVGPNAGAAPFDLISPAVRLSTVSSGQAAEGHST